jgi:transcription termination factor Rho
MNERRRPHRRGRGPRPYGNAPADSQADASSEPNPYRDSGDSESGATLDSHPPPDRPPTAPTSQPTDQQAGAEHAPDRRNESAPTGNDDGGGSRAPDDGSPGQSSGAQGGGSADGMPAPRHSNQSGNQSHGQNGPGPQGGHNSNSSSNSNNGRRQHAAHGRNSRRHRGRGPNREHQPTPTHHGPPIPVVADGETTGWFDAGRDGGYVRRASASYLAEPGDAYVPTHVVRQYALRRGDAINATVGRDQRGRVTVVEVSQINGGDPALAARRPDFSSLIATYPERKLTLETGRPAKTGPELTRRAIDLIAPIGYGQRALIVAPARAGKTMLLQAITEGVAVNHPNAVLLVLLVDERPEEVSEMITWGYGEVVASSFDQPAERHTDVAEMVLERARRLVEMGRDVVIVLDSITRLARAHNTVERGTGRTLSGGLDATAMAKPKAFFGSARSVAPNVGGGSITIIATALVETGSRMDDVIFEEFKGTGNCEIKLDRSLAEKRIFPAIDIATSGTRREDKLFRPDQLDGVYTLRRGLQQMPPQSAMEWLIKRIAATTNNDALLTGL